MRVAHVLKPTLTLIAISLSVACPGREQENVTSSRTQVLAASAYSNSTEGLRKLLEDLRAAAKMGDEKKVAAFVKNMEIPNCEAWLHKMYESDQADSWMGLCDANILGQKEKSMKELFAQLGKQEGEISTRKVNDNPEPGRGMEWGWLQAIRLPLDIYFASWKTAGGLKDSKGNPIGYFMFIDGGFRWESSIEVGDVPLKISTAKIVPQKLIQKVDPVYPPEAAAHNISGIVRVYYDIGADGLVRNAHAISGEGFSNDPFLRKAAEDAVLQWRFQPATLDGKPAQISSMKIDITFSPKR